MGFSNNTSSVLDLEAQAAEKRRELEQLVTTLDSHNEMIEDAKASLKKIEKALKSAQKDLDVFLDKKAKIEKDSGDESGKIDSALKDKKTKLDKVSSELMESTEANEKILIENGRLTEHRDKLRDEETDLKKAIKEFDDQLEVMKNELFQREENFRKTSTIFAQKIKELEKEEKKAILSLETIKEEIKEAVKDRDEAKAIEKDIKKKKKIQLSLQKENDKLEASRDKKLKEISDREEAVDKKEADNAKKLELSLGELSIREQKVEDIKKYLGVVIPKLAKIDAKAVFKIDLTKI